MPFVELEAPVHDEVLTIKEAAKLLKLAEKTVYSMAQKQELPAFKVRGQWRIRRVDFTRWLAEQAQVAGVATTDRPAG